MQKIYLDSNVLIGFLSNDPITGMVTKILEQADKAKLKVYGSVIIYGEVLRPSGSANKSSSAFLESSPIDFAKVDKITMLTAAKLRESENLRLPDAIHLATAIELECEYFITQDKKLAKIASKFIKAGSVEQFLKAQK